MVLPSVAPSSGQGHTVTVALAPAFAVFALTLVRRLLDIHLSWVRRYSSQPGGTLGAVLALALQPAACTE